MAVLIGGLVSRGTVLDGSSGDLQLRNAYGVHTLSLGGTTFVYVTGLYDDGLSAFELAPDGTLTNIQNIDDGPVAGALEIRGATAINSATVGGVTYLYVAGSIDDGISVFEVASDGTLTSIQNLADDAALQIRGIEGRMAVATVDGTTFLVATGDDDNGFSVFQVNGDGTLSNTQNVNDAGVLELDNAMDAIAVQVGARTFVVVAGEDDNGLSVFELHGDGTVTNTFNVTDGGVLNLWGAMGLATATVDGTTYLIASGGHDDGLSVFSVSASGQLANVHNVSDSAALGLAGAQGLTTFTIDTATFLAVSGRDDDALSIFHVGAGGVLTNVTAAFDTAGLALDGTFHNAFANVGGTNFLIATGYEDNSLGTFEIGGGDDTLVGTAGFDLLLGLGGDDTLDGAGGSDRFVGGSGDDTYLVDSTGDQVVEEAGAGSDTVRASASYALGSDVENLVLLGAAALNGTGNGLANEITGNAGNNGLQGLGGDDTLDGGEGLDEAVFTGPAASYSIVQNQDGTVTVTDLRDGSPDGTDELASIERLHFADVVLDPDGTPADNQPPTDITVQGGTVAENAAAGTLVATLGGVDPDPGETFSFGIEDPTGSFVVSGNRIRVAQGARIDYESQSSFTVTISVTDSAGYNYAEDLVIEVRDVADGVPSVIVGTSASDKLDGTAGRDEVRGRGGNDTLLGRDGADLLMGGTGRDRLVGGKGSDDLVGGRERDTLVGNKGPDDFIFTWPSDSGPSAKGRDRIEDFGQGDRIVVRAIDAVKGKPGDQSFRLDHDGVADAGDIRVRDVRAGVIVELNVDGDARAEMTILLAGFHGHLNDSDFVF
jgi:hypothetical protein